MTSFILIQFLPHLLDLLPLLLGRLAIQPRPLKPLRPQAHVDFVFRFRTVASYFPEEAAGVAFVEGGDDVGAIYGVED